MTRPRLLTLDLIRLLAVGLVFGCHFEAIPRGWHSLFRPFFEAWMAVGSTGVDLFFVLSGFLISGLLFEEHRKHGEISVSRFYARRGLKILPPYYLMIALTYGLLCYEGNPPAVGSLVSELLFLQGYAGSFWNHTWTLAVEIHFYLLLPLLLSAILKRKPVAVPWIIAATSLGFLLVRIVNFVLRPEPGLYPHAFNTHLRLDAPLFGVAISYAYHFHGESFRRMGPARYVLIVLGVALLTPAIYCPEALSAFYRFTFRYSQYYLGAGALLTGLLLCEVPKHRWVERVAKLGTYSYSIYLWHMIGNHWPLALLKEGLSWPMRQLMFIASALIVGTGMALLARVILREPARSARPKDPFSVNAHPTSVA